MIKVTIHIENYREYMDEDVCKDVKLQCLPRIGDTFWIDTETQKMFCDTIHKKIFMKGMAIGCMGKVVI